MTIAIVRRTFLGVTTNAPPEDDEEGNFLGH
jgi:hypothetical protein